MYSFDFPHMLNTRNSRLIEDKQAVKSNLLLLLNVERLSLFGDPYFGTALKKALFEQAKSPVIDLLVDEIHTTIVTFMPQIFIKREDIVIWTDKVNLFCELKYTYLLDNTSDLYVIQLTNSEKF